MIESFRLGIGQISSRGGDVVEAVRHMRTMNRETRILVNMPVEEVVPFCKENGIPFELAMKVALYNRLVNM